MLKISHVYKSAYCLATKPLSPYMFKSKEKLSICLYMCNQLSKLPSKDTKNGLDLNVCVPFPFQSQSPGWSPFYPSLDVLSYQRVQVIYSLTASFIKTNIILFIFKFSLWSFRVLRLTFGFAHRTNRCVSMNKFLTRVTSFHRWWLLSSRSLCLVFRELIYLNESR